MRQNILAHVIDNDSDPDTVLRRLENVLEEGSLSTSLFHVRHERQ